MSKTKLAKQLFYKIVNPHDEIETIREKALACMKAASIMIDVIAEDKKCKHENIVHGQVIDGGSLKYKFHCKDCGELT